VSEGQPTASLALIDALTSERDALAHEIAALRALPAPAEQVAPVPWLDAARWQRLRTFEAIVEDAPDGIVVTTIDGAITYANRAFFALTGYGAEILGTHLNDLIAPEERRFVPAVIQRLLQVGTWQGTRTYMRRDGSTFEANLSLVLIQDEAGQPQQRAAIIRDLTRQRRLEQEQLLLQEQVIETQQSQLRELHTPVLRLAPGVVIVPLAGGVDEPRASEIFEALLGTVAGQAVATVIVDIDGRSALSSSIAQLLLRVSHALHLLGTQMVVTGVTPPLGQSLDALGLHGR
jgi:rsbT co-antagonist protein RsbR